MPTTNQSDNIYTADGTLAGNRNVAFNNHDLAFDTDKLFINGTNGNVGIGTNTPSEKLEAAGDILSSGGDIFLISNKNGINVNQDSGTLMNFRLANQNIAQLSRIGTNHGQFKVSQYSTGSTADNYPAYSFTADSNSGLVLYGADSVGIVTGGTTRLIATSNGRVGIGTTSPDSQLQVNGNAHINKDLKVDDSEIIYTQHDYKDEGLNGEILNWNLLQTEKTDDPNDRDFATITSGTGYKQTFPITRWKIGDEGHNGQHYGYVGYFPDTMAHDGAFRVNTAGHEETDLILGVGTKDVVYIDNHNFYVGLGTDMPDQLLDVAGNMRLRNAFYDRNNQHGTAGQILSSTATGTDWIDINSLSVNSLWDSDHDTGVQVEESADDDTIRFDTAGTERMTLSNAGDFR